MRILASLLFCLLFVSPLPTLGGYGGTKSFDLKVSGYGYAQNIAQIEGITVVPGFTVSLFASVKRPCAIAFPASGNPFGSTLFVANGTLAMDVGPPDTIVNASILGVSIFTTLTAESDPFGGLEFGPGSVYPFEDHLYVSANNLDFGQPSDQGGSILQVYTNGSWAFLTSSSPPCILQEPGTISFDPSGIFGTDMFVTNGDQSPGALVTLNTNGAVSKVLLPSGGLCVQGVQFGLGGQFGTDLYYLDSIFGQVNTMDSNGTSTLFVDLPPQYEYRHSTMKFSKGGTFGTALFVAATNNATDRVSILRISANGTIEEFASGFLGTTISGSLGPVALRDILEFSDDGNILYVADYDGNAVYEIKALPVGGFYVPVDKLSLLVPYIVSAITVILVASISVAYIKYRKKQ